MFLIKQLESTNFSIYKPNFFFIFGMNDHGSDVGVGIYIVIEEMKISFWAHL